MLTQLGKNAKKASRSLMTASCEVKNKALSAIADALEENAQYIISHNAEDLKNARENLIKQGTEFGQRKKLKKAVSAEVLMQYSLRTQLRRAAKSASIRYRC
mgnify:CR=1 FL=1